MEWKKAKNYTIIFLIAVNCMLMALNLIKHNETRLSSEDITAVTKVLADRGITISCQLPEDFSSMEQLYMRAYEYDNIVLQDIFFGKISGVRRTEAGGDIIFSGEEGILILSDEKVTFRSETQAPENTEAAKAYVQKYVDSLNFNFADYREKLIKETNDGYYFEYGQSFHNRLVLSNYLKAWVSYEGIAEIEFNYQQPIDYKGSSETIISANEAVYAAADAILQDNAVAVVDMVEKGYCLNEKQGTDYLVAVPQYKIYVDYEGERAAYFVNAYSGDVTEDK